MLLNYFNIKKRTEKCRKSKHSLHIFTFPVYEVLFPDTVMNFLKREVPKAQQSSSARNLGRNHISHRPTEKNQMFSK